ncbi:hypothetical protein GGS23DRAFT_333428 [Durotheca rogersii]|uniref:uncharacterized protein n=1 Tax=Durotheca rogersii TaxID=419775 RepID=UPI002220F7E3|nr:uncharacterized protein GGS23DRAFT_333428 [Durotheca rogersii]KAI5858281.1 hypothetical protein GGS23DRAFT_333428 [Durotheca rogersii]
MYLASIPPGPSLRYIPPGTYLRVHVYPRLRSNCGGTSCCCRCCRLAHLSGSFPSSPPPSSSSPAQHVQGGHTLLPLCVALSFCPSLVSCPIQQNPSLSPISFTTWSRLLFPPSSYITARSIQLALSIHHLSILTYPAGLHTYTSPPPLPPSLRSSIPLSYRSPSTLTRSSRYKQYIHYLAYIAIPFLARAKKLLSSTTQSNGATTATQRTLPN